MGDDFEFGTGFNKDLGLILTKFIMDKKQFLAMSLPYGLKMCYTYENRIDIQALLPMHFDCKCQLVNERGKPILRPLSDLAKEIEHNGETFIPIERIGIYNPNNVDYLIDQILSEFVEFSVMETLVRWHFDVICLIPRGEAVDVNTLSGSTY